LKDREPYPLPLPKKGQWYKGRGHYTDHYYQIVSVSKNRTPKDYYTIRFVLYDTTRKMKLKRKAEEWVHGGMMPDWNIRMRLLEKPDESDLAKLKAEDCRTVTLAGYDPRG
jgi:hypothetical protein